MKTNQIDALLKAKYTEPEHALFFEVPANPDSSGRRIDALSIALWRSRAFAITGFEVKASRSDWLRELKDPSKGEELFKYCDYFYVVASQVSGKDIVKADEIPENWGYMRATPKGLRIIKKAPKLVPLPMTQAFMVSILRREGRREAESLVAKARMAVADERASINQAIDSGIQSRTRSLKNELSNIKLKIEQFEKETGVPLSKTSGFSSRLSAGQLGKAVKFVIDSGMVGENWNGARLRQNFLSIQKDIEKLSPLIDAFITPTQEKPPTNNQ